jgi:hypothetical protein
MDNQFQKAARKSTKIRMAIVGVSGSGKTMTALTAAKGLANGGKIAVVYTESNSIDFYSDLFDFDKKVLEYYSPDEYIKGISMAEDNGYAVVVIDSLSHAWIGKGGLLAMHSREMSSGVGNSFTAWGNVTPEYQRLMDKILNSSIHVIATMRRKTDYVMQENSKGKMAPVKVGLTPVMKPDTEYEFDMVAEMDMQHRFHVSNTKIEWLDGKQVIKPTAKWFEPLRVWLDGEDTIVETVKETFPQAQVVVENLEPEPNPEPLESNLTSETQDLGISNAVPVEIPEPPFGVLDDHMAYDIAYAVKNRDGVMYGTLESTQLVNMHNALAKSIKKTIDEDEKNVKQGKIKAIRSLMAHRNGSNFAHKIKEEK